MNASYMMNTYKRFPITFTRGDGALLFDSEGKQYLDLLAGIAVTSAGHANPVIAEAVAAQARRLVHVSNLFLNDAVIAASEKLIKTVGWGRAFFCNSGAEANECAIKLARRVGNGTRFKVLCAEGGFHGRTLAALAATGQPSKWKGFAPLPAGFLHARFNDLASFQQQCDDEVAAILIEPVQGEHGVIPATKEFLMGLRALADERGILLMFDEIQTGVGRTGSWWAFQQYGVKPDVITSAKALANGLPIGACIADEPYASVFGPGDHGSTFGGGALVAEAARATLTYLESEGILAHVAEMSEYLQPKLRAMPHVTEVRGLGLMLGVVLDGRVAGRVVEECLKCGIILNAPAEEVIRIIPPLVITRTQLDQALDVLSRTLSTVAV